jgi:hypothetical protein
VARVRSCLQREVWGQGSFASLCCLFALRDGLVGVPLPAREQVSGWCLLDFTEFDHKRQMRSSRS